MSRGGSEKELDEVLVVEAVDSHSYLLLLLLHPLLHLL